MLPAIGSFCRSLSGLFLLVSVRQRASFPSTFNRLFYCSVPSRSSNSFSHSGLNTSKGKSSVHLYKHPGQVQVNRNITMSATLMDSQNVEFKKAKLNGKENQSFEEQDESSRLYFVKMSSTASAPMKGSKLAAGYDLRSAYDAVVPARGSALIKTDIQIKLPRGTYGRVAPRSGLAWKNKIDVGAGVIDEDYRGNVGVILFNHSDEDFKVEVGDRIAQLICEKIVYPDILEIGSLEESERGANGFGSTGTKN